MTNNLGKGSFDKSKQKSKVKELGPPHVSQDTPQIAGRERIERFTNRFYFFCYVSDALEHIHLQACDNKE